MNYRDKFYMAQKCINEIDDFLEYRYRGLSGSHIREIIMGYVAEYAHDVSESYSVQPEHDRIAEKGD